MLDLAIIIILIFGFFIGLKRGFILQLLHLMGFILAFIIAHMFYADLAPKLTLWIPYPNINSDTFFGGAFSQVNLEAAYYRAIAFAAIFFAVKIVLQIIASMLDFVASLPILKQLNVWAGGLLGFVEVYLIIFILLYIAALLPMDVVQLHLDRSVLAEAIVKHTPVLSEQVKQLWIEYMAA
ncbi:CvpA family protein [Mesobacillus harenae]|uniref:CvpA family protein n=1 Tax=Mesobacillus harenae TaxID=2213203 RepID=UPI00157FBF79|nr:CvpA family protein [Mesobacillus harenae]